MASEFVDPLAYDWFAPSASVTLINDGGKSRFPLWMTTDELEKNAASVGLTAKHLAMFREITVDWQGAFYQITIQLTPDYETAIAVLNSHLIQQGVTELEAKLGLATGGSELESTFLSFSARIIQVSFSLGTEISITIKAVPTGEINVKSASATEQLNSQSRRSIIKKMWELVTRGNYFDDTNVKTDPSKKLLDQAVTVNPAGKTPMAIIQQMLEETKCIMLIKDGKGLVLYSRDGILSGPASAVFKVYVDGRVGGGKGGVLPILTASSQSQWLFTRTVFTRETKGVDPSKKQSWAEQAAAFDKEHYINKVGLVPEAAPQGKGTTGPNKKATNTKDGAKIQNIPGQSPAATPEKEGTKQEVEISSDSWATGVDLKVDTLFLPTLIPFQVVTVSGLSKRIDGNFLVTKVTHRVGQDGGQTTWEGRNNGQVPSPNSEKPMITNKTQPAKPEDSGKKTVQAKKSK